MILRYSFIRTSKILLIIFTLSGCAIGTVSTSSYLCTPCTHLGKVQYESSILLFELLNESTKAPYNEEFYKEIKRQLQSLKYSTNVLKRSGDFHLAINKIMKDVEKLQRLHVEGISNEDLLAMRTSFSQDIKTLQILVESLTEEDIISPES